jgi:hypothetical protein
MSTTTPLSRPRVTGEQLQLFTIPPIPPGSTRCHDCDDDVVCLREWFMVHDDVWTQTGLAPRGGMLCVGCCEDRLGRRLTPADFTDCLGDPSSGRIVVESESR